MFTQRYILLAADTYRIVNDSTGEINEGMNIWYLMDDTLVNLDHEARGENISKGIKPTQASLPFESINKLKSVPGMYEMSFDMTTIREKARYEGGHSKMSATIVMKDIKFVGDIEVKVKPEKAQ